LRKRQSELLEGGKIWGERGRKKGLTGIFVRGHGFRIWKIKRLILFYFEFKIFGFIMV